MNQQRSCDGIGLGDFGLTREELLVPNTRAKMNRVVSCTMGDLINRGKVARQSVEVSPSAINGSHAFEFTRALG